MNQTNDAPIAYCVYQKFEKTDLGKLRFPNHYLAVWGLFLREPAKSGTHSIAIVKAQFLSRFHIMLRKLILATLLSTGLAQAATMSEMQLDGLLTGNTLYLNIPAGGPALPEGGVVPFKYGADGSAAARLSAKMTLIGTWSLKDDHYCVDWDNGPKNSCTKLVKTTVGIELIDFESGETRGTVERIVPGNPEGI